MLLNNYCYILLIYIGVTISIHLALSTSVLFMSFIQSLNATQFLNITFLFVLLASAPAAAVLLNYIFPLTSIYASL